MAAKRAKDAKKSGAAYSATTDDLAYGAVFAAAAVSDVPRMDLLPRRLRRKFDLAAKRAKDAKKSGAAYSATNDDLAYGALCLRQPAYRMRRAWILFRAGFAGKPI